MFRSQFRDASIAGMILRNRDAVTPSWSIYINRTDPPQRQRLTLAHEVGHFVLHLRQMPHLGGTGTTAPALLSRCGAAGILMRVNAKPTSLPRSC